jgi:serine/threonine protein kinase
LEVSEGGFSMVGRTILHYAFLEKLGAGGMGEIYKAHDTRLNRFVAIKVLSTAARGDPDLRARQRFTQEAQAASALNHPHIITIHDILSEEGADFMVMEFVSGKTLVDLIPKGGLRVPQVLKYSVQMADALQAAHSNGIVHRDFKPGNVMVTESGFVKVLDFGLAKMADSGPLGAVGGSEDETKTMKGSPLTIEGSIIGTVSYMSPEQAQGKKVDTRSDIFSFGVVLYEMATGERAFQGDSTLTTLSAILRDEVRPLAEFAPEAPPQLEQVIRRCLKKTPDDRWQTMKDVQMALTALKYESDSGRLRPRVSEPPPAPAGVQAGGGKKINLPGPALAGALAVVIALVLAGIGGRVWWKHHNVPPPVEQAVVATPGSDAAAAPGPPETPADATASAQNPAPPADGSMTNDQVIQMVEGKVSPNLIIGQIRSSSKTDFVLTPAELIRLSKAGVPDAVIEAMRNPKRGASSTPAPGSASTSVTAPTPASSAKPTPKQETPPPPQQTVAPQPQEPAQPTTPQTPQSQQASANPAAKAPAPPSPSNPAPSGNLRIVTVKDGTPFKITLAEDIPESVQEGRPLRFTVSEDVRDGDSIVIAKGAAVAGAIAEVPGKKVFGFIGGGRLTFKVTSVDGVDSHKFNIRAVQTRSEGSYRPVELPNAKAKSKDLAASAGTEGYVAYIDGDQTVSVRK